MPIIEGADMTSVSTDRELLPEGWYTFTILDSAFSEDNSALIIKRRIEEAPDGAERFVGQESWDWINRKQKDGSDNPRFLETIKKYLEAVFGKDSNESNTPDTDPLHGHLIKIYYIQKAGKKQAGETEAKMFNNARKYEAAE